MNAAPVLIGTRDDSLARALAEQVGDLPHIIASDLAVIAQHGPHAAVVVLGADMLGEVTTDMLAVRYGVFIAVTDDGPAAYLSGVATLPGCPVELSQSGALEWLGSEVRRRFVDLAAIMADPGAPLAGCDECGAGPGEPCRVGNCGGSWY